MRALPMLLLAGLLAAASPLEAGGTHSHRALGQVLYVPVYSHIPMSAGVIVELAATVSIRNTDADHAIELLVAHYYDNDGNLVREEVKKPVLIKPMASTRFFVKVNDTIGGVGANYIVEWRAARPVSPPVVETVMVGGIGQKMISFLSTARVLSEVTE